MEPGNDGLVKSTNQTDNMSNQNDDDDNTQDSTTESTSSSTSSATLPSSSEQLRNDKSSWTGSLVEYYGPSSSYCGYCKRVGDNGRRSYDMQAFQLTANDYQEFLDRGWRRSGEFCYCPINQTTCCPNFSITCKAIKFRLTRSQHKCIEHLNNFLVTGSVKQNAPIVYKYKSSELFREKKASIHVGKSFEQLKKSTKARDRRYVKTCERKSRLHNISHEEAMNQIREKWQQRRPETFSLEDYLYPRRESISEPIQTKHRLEINMFFVNSRQSKELRNEEQAIIVKYQKQVHKETSREWTMSRYSDFLVNSPIIVQNLENYDYLQCSEDELSKETLSKDVHSTTTSTFYLHKPPQLPTAYGTYHCSYHLNGKLIAVGVLDVLPKCITTVYFFYDPEYAFLNLGVYSALVEISMIRQMWSRYQATPASVENKGNILEHYYLGYYVHECRKMHYKTRFKPSFLLCCKSYDYIPTAECLKKLENNKYAEFSEVISNAREVIEFKKLLEVSIEWPIEIEQFAMTNTKLLNYLIWLETELGTEYVELFVNGYLATFAHLVGTDLLVKLCLKTNSVHRTLLKRRDRLMQCRHSQKLSADSQSSSGKRAL